MGQPIRFDDEESRHALTDVSREKLHVSGPYLRVVKPAIDRVVGFVMMLLTLPVLAVAAALVRIKMGKPIFHNQERVGLNGSTFKLYKLRTMVPDRRTNREGYTGPDRRQTHKSPNDPRVQSLGRALRSSRLDELPQFVNVVLGDMSLVGPRPELPEIVASYAPWQHGRHAVKPGVTGLWQISKQNGSPMHECTDVDIEYVENVGFGTDLAILLKTPLAMFGRRQGF